MGELSKTEIMDRCSHRLVGHGVPSIQKTLLALADYVDPHLAKDRFDEKLRRS